MQSAGPWLQQRENDMKDTQKAIIRTLLYFDIFDHPLDRTELLKLNGTRLSEEKFDHALEELVSAKIIGHESGYFFLGDGSSKIKNRTDRHERSLKHNRIAQFVSGMIFKYPFVRAVMITGSLSKKSQSRKADIDFFVITEPGRLWLCRTILMLFKKIFLLNSKKYFCINYFIDSAHLEIPERNIFTATELAFLQPMHNTGLYCQFMKVNAWMKSYFPNWREETNRCRDSANPLIKRALEKAFKGKSGDKLDTVLMNIYKKRSLRKFRDTHKHLFFINFKTEKHVSKHHPSGFQQRILDQYDLKITEFEMKHKIDLTI